MHNRTNGPPSEAYCSRDDEVRVEDSNEDKPEEHMVARAARRHGSSARLEASGCDGRANDARTMCIRLDLTEEKGRGR